MSGLHEMFPYFSNTFLMVSPKKASDRSSKLDQSLNLFEDALTEKLKQLKPKNVKGFLNMSWLQGALEILSQMHKDLKTLIAGMHFPARAWAEKWVEQYLDDTLKVMDICISLNSEISKLEETQMIIQFVLHMLDFSAGIPSSEKFSCAKDSLLELVELTNLRGKNKKMATPCTSGKIENCTAILEGLSKSLQFGKVKMSAKGKVLLSAMYGVKATTIFVCSVATTALSGSLASFVEAQVPDQYLWSATFKSLQSEFHQEIKANFEDAVILKELKIVDAAVLSVLSNVVKGTGESEQMKMAVQELRQSVELLTQGVDPLARKVDDFFVVVLKGRNALLDSLRLFESEDAFKGDDSARQ